MKKVVAVVLLIAGLYGCATPYQDQAPFFQPEGGFMITGLRGGMFRVRFDGNDVTTLETAKTYTLYRSAVLTQEQGFAGFEVITETQDPDAADREGTYAMQIRLLKEPFAPAPPKIFSASALKAALEPYVMGKKCENGNVCPHDHAYLRATP